MSLPSTTSPPKATANSTQSDIGFLQHELTPESKIKALLAKIDEDTDSDGGRLSQDFLKGEKVQHPERNVSSPISVVDRQYRRNSNETDDDGSDEAPIVPRGRLAARLHGRNVTIGSLPNSRIGESPGNTYEKLKNQPLQNTDQEDLIMEEPMADLSDVENIVHSQLPRSRKNLSEVSSPVLFFKSKSDTASQSPRNSALFEESDSDLPAEPQINKRLQTLLTRKKEELKAKEATELKRKAERRAQDGVEATNLDAKRSRRDSFSSSSSRDDSDDRAADKKLTQQSRPTRKASKRALEEMSRETQRMSRNMQLAHQAKTKKKITKESFLGRFNLGATKLEDTSLPSNPSSSTIRSSEAPSDVDMQGNDSPPTSPAPSNDTIHKFHEPDEPEIALEDVQRVLPSGLFLLSKSPRELAELSAEPAESNNETSGIKLTHHSRAKSSNPSVIARLSKTALRPDPIDFDSGSDLEIVPDRRHKESKLGVFDRLPTNKAQEKRSLQTLRVLACMNSPGQKTTSSRPSMTMFDMQKSLQMRARKQAAAERAEKIQDLKDRGVIIQTAEERQKDQAEVEDLVDKARKEAMAIMQKEKQIAKSKKILHHEKDITDGSSDEDEDYQANDADQSDLELSGSEEEDSSEKEHVDDGSESESESELMDDEADGGVEILTKRPDLDNLIEAEASEDGNEAASHQDEDNSHDECLEITNSRKSRVQRIVLDEDTSEDEEALVLQSPAPVTNAIQSPPIAGIPFANIIPMGMTQAFAATIAETQTQEASRADREQDSLDLMGSVPEPDFPLHDLDAREVVLDSQMDREQDDVDKNGNDTTMEIDIHLPQSPTMGNVLNGLQELPPTLTQFSEIPDPTQDVGFALNSPVPNRFVSVPPSTVDTVLLSRNPNTPTVKRKSRLRRGTELSNAIIDIKEDSQPVSGTTGSAITADAFDVLKKAAREKTRPTEVFDKKKSEAKEMVEEQAQESEDEYAGLGGASDDESAGEEDEEVRKMIDEEDVDVDERKLAAFHA